jgi:HAD superfamily hydrolase (TIGR01509 family)
VGTVHEADPGAALLAALTDRGVAPLPAIDALRAERQRRRERMIAQSDIMPGVLELIAAAQAAGLRLGIASSSPRERIERYLDHLARRGTPITAAFTAIVTRDQVGNRPKPDPAVYHGVLAALEARPEEALAVEDSLHGVRAAQAAGIFTVAVPNRSTRLLDFGEADVILPSLLALNLADYLTEGQAC